MKCPRCQTEFTISVASTTCPRCGFDWHSPQDGSASPNSPGDNWGRFFLILVAPAAGCFASMALTAYPLAMLFSLVGSIIAGLLCSRIIMASHGGRGLGRMAMHFAVALVMCGLAFFLSSLGCGAGARIGH